MTAYMFVCMNLTSKKKTEGHDRKDYFSHLISALKPNTYFAGTKDSL